MGKSWGEMGDAEGAAFQWLCVSQLPRLAGTCLMVRPSRLSLPCLLAAFVTLTHARRPSSFKLDVVPINVRTSKETPNVQ